MGEVGSEPTDRPARRTAGGAPVRARTMAARSAAQPQPLAASAAPRSSLAPTAPRPDAAASMLLPAVPMLPAAPRQRPWFSGHAMDWDEAKRLSVSVDDPHWMIDELTMTDFTGSWNPALPSSRQHAAAAAATTTATVPVRDRRGGPRPQAPSRR